MVSVSKKEALAEANISRECGSSNHGSAEGMSPNIQIFRDISKNLKILGPSKEIPIAQQETRQAAEKEL